MTRLLLEVPGGPDAPGLARRRVVGDLGDAVRDAVRDDVALLVSELVTNSVRHSRAGSGMIGVEILLVSGVLRLTVSDPGGVTAPHLVDPDRRHDGGLGLVLVDKLSSAWGVTRERDGVVRVWCEVRL